MIIQTILLILAIPAGFLIAWMARDELVQGREWFRGLVIAPLALAGLFWLLGISYLCPTLVFIAIISFISFVKSKDRKWTKKRI